MNEPGKLCFIPFSWSLVDPHQRPVVWWSQYCKTATAMSHGLIDVMPGQRCTWVSPAWVPMGETHGRDPWAGPCLADAHWRQLYSPVGIGLTHAQNFNTTFGMGSVSALSHTKPFLFTAGKMQPRAFSWTLQCRDFTELSWGLYGGHFVLRRIKVLSLPQPFPWHTPGVKFCAGNAQSSHLAIASKYVIGAQRSEVPGANISTLPSHDCIERSQGGPCRPYYGPGWRLSLRRQQLLYWC